MSSRLVQKTCFKQLKGRCHLLTSIQNHVRLYSKLCWFIDCRWRMSKNDLLIIKIMCNTREVTKSCCYVKSSLYRLNELGNDLFDFSAINKTAEVMLGRSVILSHKKCMFQVTQPSHFFAPLSTLDLGPF